MLQPANDIYQPLPFGSVFPPMRLQQKNSGTSPSVDPMFPNTSPKARKVSTSPSSDPASSNTGTELKERRQSTAQAKYTPINYTPEFYAPSPPPPISDRVERQLPPKPYKSPSPAEHLQPYATASPVEQPCMASSPFVSQPGGSSAVGPRPNSTQQHASPAYGTVIVPYPTSADLEYPPYGRHASPRNFSPLSNNTGYYSLPRSPHSPHSHSSKDGDRTDNRDGSRSSRLRETLKERKDVGASVLGTLAGGLLGSELGHNRTMGTMLGAAVGGIGANFAESMRKEERKFKHRRRRHDELDKGQHYKDGYDSY